MNILTNKQRLFMGSEKMKSTLKWNLVGTDKGHARKFLKKITIANNVF